MAEGYLGEIRMFGGNFAPRFWALCNGQLLAIAGNEELFSLIDTIYGGDGRSSFGLPDFRGRIPVHSGNSTGPGLLSWVPGQKSGSEICTLTQDQIPAHKHALVVSDAQGSSGTPYETLYGNTTGTNTWFYKEYGATQAGQFNSDTMGTTGGDQPHENVMPSLGFSFIICMQGIYPSRN